MAFRKLGLRVYLEVGSLNDDKESIDNFYYYLNEFNQTDISDEFVLKNLKKCIKYLKNYNEGEYECSWGTGNSLLRLGSSLLYLNKNEDNLTKLLSCDFYLIYRKILNHLIDKSKDAPFKFAENITYIFSTFGHISDYEMIAAENLKYGFVKIALDLLKYELDESLNEFNDKILTFIQKNIRHSVTKPAFVNFDTQYITSKIFKLNESSMDDKKFLYRIFKYRLNSILNFLTEDEQLDRIPISKDIVLEFIAILEETILAKTKEVLDTKFAFFYPAGEFSCNLRAISLLQDLKKISINDNIKQIIYEANALPLIITLLDEGNKVEQEYSSELIFNFCFNKNLMNSLKTNSKFMNIIKNKAQNTKNKQTAHYCKNIIEMINQTLEKRAISLNASNKTLTENNQHIMISYNHSTKNICKKLNSVLQERGYKTWIDLSDMYHDLHDEMAKAVENASIILICYSDAYKNSMNCRLEAEYAANLRKNIIPIKMEKDYKPDGWLGLIIGGKLFINLSDMNFDEAVNDLIKRIENVFNESTANKSSIEKNSTPANNDTEKSQKRSIKEWKYKDIIDWLNENNMKEFIQVFEGYDGASLQALYEMKIKDYARFCDTFEKELEEMKIKVSLRIKMKFFQLIDDLFTK